MLINGKKVIGEHFAYDGCHKMYVCKNLQEVRESQEMGYTVYPIGMLPQIYAESCPLRFISPFDLSDYYVKQGEDAVFEEE